MDAGGAGDASRCIAGAVIALQSRILAHLAGGGAGTAEEIAQAIGAAEQVETVYLTLRHLAANRQHRVMAEGFDTACVFCGR